MLGRQQVWTSLILMLLLMIGQFVPFTYIAPLLTEVTDLSTETVPLVLLAHSGVGPRAVGLVVEVPGRRRVFLPLTRVTSIDPGLYEASEIDGAGKMKQIRYITLPGILPTITLMLVLSLSNILNVSFDQVYTMQNTMNLSASDVLDTYIFRIAMNGMITDYSRGIAMGLFRAVICLILFGTANFASRRLGSGSVF